jgi:hypothetical protein
MRATKIEKRRANLGGEEMTMTTEGKERCVMIKILSI